MKLFVVSDCVDKHSASLVLGFAHIEIVGNLGKADLAFVCVHDEGILQFGVELHWVDLDHVGQAEDIGHGFLVEPDSPVARDICLHVGLQDPSIRS